ncbi:inorganic diphosphatase [Mucilaginibacter sp. 14171R-50]|uniref:inorganic diphosphatase n=1 Tax=Mucilaginibacter sp. 14171R-50 TaxID=2703789 RepID=UPI00138C81D5|nr:inorganic diphosphatase [Mucilaginibacter sp. 14171R-50]QHS57560.1 inorganic diphosphatase [Mucilaginibacter sp. 14171R-50]
MESITVIVETPKGSGLKYDYEPKLKAFKLKKVLPAGMVFPFDFGFIPDTRGDDGDPLDVVVIAEQGTFTGCYVDCRIIGAIKASHTERDGSTMRNDRYLAVPEVSNLFKDVSSLMQLPDAILTQLESFFANYNELAGKKFEVIERVGAEEAYQTIKG